MFTHINTQHKSILLLRAPCVFLLMFALSGPGCKKFIQVGAPVTSLTGSNVYKTDATAISVLTGLYTSISNEQPNTISLSNISSLTAGLSADEFTLWSGVNDAEQIAFYKNSLVASANMGAQYWYDSYKYIFTCNAAIEGLEGNTLLTQSVRDQLLGEARFMRAFLYFYLVNLYGTAPLVIKTNYEVNKSLSRASSDLVYAQIVADLNAAKELLGNDYLNSTLLHSSDEKIRPNKGVASALLSRVYLYMEKWPEAESEASLLINDNRYSLDSLNDVFLKNSKEAIFQLQPTLAGYNTQQARLFILPEGGPNSSNPLYISNSLFYSFENNDARKKAWTDSVTVDGVSFHFPTKYKIAQQDNNIASPADMQEYFMIFRLGEQYLIRAEARARLEKIAGSQDDLNAIRNRAHLDNTTASTSTELLKAILRERRIELFAEWGHRWLDIKRSTTIDSVMKAAMVEKGGTWENFRKYYPIPTDDILKNANLRQTPGY